MANNPKYYWDACALVGLIRQEPDKIDSLRYLMEMAQKGKIEIWTSAFTLAEVFKRKCSEIQVGIEPADDAAFEDYLAQDCVQRVQVDVDVGTFARRLLRKFPIRKPQDAIHAATAALNKIDELHTFDGSDLLPLDGQISMSNGEKLRICKPPVPPDPDKGTLLELLKSSPVDQEDASKTNEANRCGARETHPRNSARDRHG